MMHRTKINKHTKIFLTRKKVKIIKTESTLSSQKLER
jgi:hypothetical protein